MHQQRRLLSRPAGLLTIFATALVASLNCIAFTDDTRPYNQRDLAMLPNYCLYTQAYRVRFPGGNNPSEISRWEAVMGESFHHMHHYCWGIMETNYANLYSKSIQERNHHLTSS